MDQFRRVQEKIKLHSKIKQFKTKFQQSEKVMRNKSANVRLADKIFSEMKSPQKQNRSNSNFDSKTKDKRRSQTNKKNKSFSPLKNKKLNSSEKRLNSSERTSSNKSLTTSKLLIQSLDDKTLYLSQLVKKTSDLILQKKQFQQTIAYYKQQIASENHILQRTKIRTKQLQQKITIEMERKQKKQKNNIELVQLSKKQISQTMNIKKLIDSLIDQKNVAKYQLKSLKSINRKHNLIRKTIQKSTKVKGQLRQSQKKLLNQAVYKQQLDNKKANLIIQANQIANKIQCYKNYKDN